MSDMVEKVARAIYEKRNGRGCRPWPLQANWHKEPYLQDAETALRALREPTFAMVEAPAPMEIDPGTADDVWRAMIDAALSEERE